MLARLLTLNLEPAAAQGGEAAISAADEDDEDEKGTSMTTDNPDPLLESARRERARRWFNTDLRGYPTLRAEAETEATLAAEPNESQVKKGKTGKEAT